MTDPAGEIDDLVAAEQAITQARWSEALELLDRHPAAASATGLELRARAAYGAGDPEGSIAAWESLYRLHLGLHDEGGAARAAAMVAMYLMIDTGLMSPIRGWLRRAERLSADAGEAQVDALVAMVRTYERLWCGDMVAAGASSARAIELGRQHDFAPAVIIGTVAHARLSIFDGRTDEGIEMLDDVAVSLASGEVDAMTSGMAYCELICAAQGLALYDRAREWTQAMEHWRHTSAFGGFGGRCRVHRAEMLRLTGPCDLAEHEALEACEELRPWMRREFGWPLTELGNIRLRKGDLQGAEEAFVAAHHNSWTPQPGLALLRLRQGDLDTAAALIEDAIENPFDVPSKERPPYGGLRKAPLLDAQVEIAVARGDVATARRAADELREIAETFLSPAILAAAALAQGRTALAGGDGRRAVEECERALASWIELGAPFEAAVVRLTLGQARQVSGNAEGARMEWAAARRAFAEFGAAGWSEPATGPDRPEPAATTEPSCTFRRDGDIRTVTFDGRTTQLRDLLGLRYLERLLAEPYREFHVLDLVAVERGSLPVTPRPGDLEAGRHGEGPAGCHLDAQAREAYRRRLLDIDEDIEDATRANDLDRIALAQADREFLVSELSRAVGLGGRPRLALSTSERARTSVTRSLRYSLTRIVEHHRELGEHLRQAVSTGTYCVYRPDPRLPAHWDV